MKRTRLQTKVAEAEAALKLAAESHSKAVTETGQTADQRAVTKAKRETKEEPKIKRSRQTLHNEEQQSFDIVNSWNLPTSTSEVQDEVDNSDDDSESFSKPWTSRRTMSIIMYLKEENIIARSNLAKAEAIATEAMNKLIKKIEQLTIRAGEVKTAFGLHCMKHVTALLEVFAEEVEKHISHFQRHYHRLIEKAREAHGDGETSPSDAAST
uniref:Uncharacterized protein n=1 Tax=Caenorhabditis japonica TaxID=281687 RepID=A0A8R1DGH1_CAEJA